MTFVGEQGRVVADLDQAHFKQSLQSFGPMGVSFVRLRLISRSAQRRRIAVSPMVSLFALPLFPEKPA
jgi:hypothetical protein